MSARLSRHLRDNKMGIAVMAALAAISGYAIITARASVALPGDINNDGRVDVFDLSKLLADWGKTGSSDVDGNGRVDVFDLSIVLSSWGAAAPASTPTPTSTATVTPSTSPAQSAPPTASDQFMFGIGSQAYQAGQKRIVKEAPIKMYSSWFNSHADLSFFNQYRTSTTPQTYASGKAFHLIIWTSGGAGDYGHTGTPKGWSTSKYGGYVCGSQYPISQLFQDDIKQLAIDTAGKVTDPPLYVSMFTELQTYPCNEDDNYWDTGQAYYKELKKAYLEAKATFHQYAPNSKVAITWGGWAATFDNPSRGGGRSLLPYFKDVMDQSDFQSFQAMGNTENVNQSTWMTKALHAFGNGKVLLAHYKPDNNSLAVYDSDMPKFFNDTKMAELKANGLFAFSFMNEDMMNSSEARFQQAKAAVTKYTTGVAPWPLR